MKSLIFVLLLVAVFLVGCVSSPFCGDSICSYDENCSVDCLSESELQDNNTFSVNEEKRSPTKPSSSGKPTKPSSSGKQSCAECTQKYHAVYGCISTGMKECPSGECIPEKDVCPSCESDSDCEEGKACCPGASITGESYCFPSDTHSCCMYENGTGKVYDLEAFDCCGGGTKYAQVIDPKESACCENLENGVIGYAIGDKGATSCCASTIIINSERLNVPYDPKTEICCTSRMGLAFPGKKAQDGSGYCCGGWIASYPYDPENAFCCGEMFGAEMPKPCPSEEQCVVRIKPINEANLPNLVSGKYILDPSDYLRGDGLIGGLYKPTDLIRGGVCELNSN